MEILGLQYINAITDRWQEWLKKQGLKPTDIDPEVQLFQKVDEIYVNSHKQLLKERNEAVDEYRDSKKMALNFNEKFSKSMLPAIAQTTLAKWIRATEYFFHFMILLHSPIKTFLETKPFMNSKDEKSAQVYVNAFEVLTTSLQQPIFKDEFMNLSPCQSPMFNDFASKGLLTLSIMVAPEEVITPEMRAYMAAANKNVEEILKKIDQGITQVIEKNTAENQQQVEHIEESKQADEVAITSNTETVDEGYTSEPPPDLSSDEDTDDETTHQSNQISTSVGGHLIEVLPIEEPPVDSDIDGVLVPSNSPSSSDSE